MDKRRTLDEIHGLPTTIERDKIFRGHMAGTANYLIKGKAVGNCSLQGTLILSKGALWEGNIVADTVVISGTVLGNVTARQKLEVRRDAHIAGKVSSPVIALAEGALIKGGIKEASLVTTFIERRLN